MDEWYTICETTYLPMDQSQSSYVRGDALASGVSRVSPFMAFSWDSGMGTSSVIRKKVGYVGPKYLMSLTQTRPFSSQQQT